MLDQRFQAEEEGRKFCRKKFMEAGAEKSALLLCRKTGIQDMDAGNQEREDFDYG